MQQHKSGSVTLDELVQLGASCGLSGLTPPRTFPVSDLVAGDLSVLGALGRRLPPERDALRRRSQKRREVQQNEDGVG